MLFCHKIHNIFMINAIFPRNFVVSINALFQPIFLSRKAVTANVFAFWMYVFKLAYVVTTRDNPKFLFSLFFDTGPLFSRIRATFKAVLMDMTKSLCVQLHTVCKIIHCVYNYTLFVKLHNVCKMTHWAKYHTFPLLLLLHLSLTNILRQIIVCSWLKIATCSSW